MIIELIMFSMFFSEDPQHRIYKTLEKYRQRKGDDFDFKDVISALRSVKHNELADRCDSIINSGDFTVG